jgi:ABC-2 type transport system permease protein
LNPALLFLLKRSAVNALLSKLRRLKNPRYLVPTILGALYFLFVFGDGLLFRTGRRGPVGDGSPDPEFRLVLEWGITAVVLIGGALSWLLPVRGAPLAFLESEVALLFPAPVTRRDLVRYKLLDYQRFFVLMPILVGLLNLPRLGVVRSIFVAVGAWLAFNAMSLHGMAAKMTRLSLAEHGRSGWRRNAIPLAVLVSYLAFVALAMPPLPEFRLDGDLKREITGWLARLSDSAAGWALLPIRLCVRPMFSDGLGEFALRTAGLAALVAALYAWVMRTDVAFEEAAAGQAEALGRQIEAAKKGRLTTGLPAKAPRRHPFPLAPTGSPEMAFAWKSTAEILRGLSPRLLILLFVGLAVAAPIAAGGLRERGEVGTKVLAFAAAGMGVIAGFLVIMGPAMVGTNLRGDMERVEVLKTFPLGGARIVRCSLAGTVLPIAAAQALLVAGAVLLFPSPPKFDLTLGWRLSIAAAAIACLPLLTAASAAVDAALVLYFPSWVKPGQAVAQGGMEGMGYGMLTGVGKILALGVGLLPAAPGIVLAVVGVKIGGELWAPLWVMAGGFVAAAGLAVEVWVMSAVLGRRFEDFDPAEEGLVA